MDEGPFFHGTAASSASGDELLPGHRSYSRPGQALRLVSFTSLVPTAAWGAQLAAALQQDEATEGASERRARIYVVEPTGPFEDDPNVTDEKFPGNPTRSYRTLVPVRVLRELEDWDAHPPEAVQQMLVGLARLRAEGRDLIED